ncbi:TPA: hypothetical protein NGR52_004176 [Vibrio parahaemolyticus]|nr:hypothetical protein [Vibrio parahaemolyticus]
MEDDFIIDNNFNKNDNFYDTPLYQHYLKVVEGIAEIPENYQRVLYEKLPDAITVQEEIDETFSIREELSTQMTLVRGLRKSIFDSKGNLRPDYDLDDAKQVLTASKDLIKVIQGSQKELVNQERIQAIELAFTDAIMEFPEDKREFYLEKLALYLEQYDPD